MKEIYEMSGQMNLWVTPNAISSPVLDSGLSRSDSQVGPMIDRAGPEVVRASLSPRQAKEKGLLTSGTYGQHGSISSNTVNDPRYQSLVNRLQARTAMLGSSELELRSSGESGRSGDCSDELGEPSFTGLEKRERVRGVQRREMGSPTREAS